MNQHNPKLSQYTQAIQKYHFELNLQNKRLNRSLYRHIHASPTENFWVKTSINKLNNKKQKLEESRSY